MNFEQWKASAIGAHIDVDGAFGDQCTDVALSWAKFLFPGHAWSELIPPVDYAKQMFAHHSSFFTAEANDHNNPNQLPPQGAIMVFDATPQTGFTNTYSNPAGHTGILDSANSAGYSLIQQDGSNPGGVCFEATTAWRYRPCIGWLTPNLSNNTPPPAPTPVASGQVTLPASVSSWAAYRVGSGLRKGTSDQVGTLLPAKYGGLTYAILAWVGDYAVEITTQSYGNVVIWVKDTDAIIS